MSVCFIGRLRKQAPLDNGKESPLLNLHGDIQYPVRNEQRCCSAAECLQEALQKSCKSTGLQQSQILAAVESPLTAINSAAAAVQKIPESRSALQSGFEKTKNVVTGNGLPLVSTKKKEMQAPIIQ